MTRLRLGTSILATIFCASWALLGCGGVGTNGSVTPVMLASTYTGTEVSNGISAPVAASFSQNGSQITGTWGNEVGGIANTGTMTGTVSGTSLSATLAPNIPIQGECSTNVTGTLSGGTLSGNFTTTTGCAVPQSGSFTLQAASAPPALGGNWSGTLNDDMLGGGTISGTITQNGVTLTGTFTDSFGLSGQFYGVVIGSTIYFDLIPSMAGACPFTATGTLSGNTLTGTYMAVLCSVMDSGTFSMTL